MRVPLAWHNTFQNKTRTLAAVAGISFAVLLIFMQLGFLNTARLASTMLYEYMDFDLIMTSNQYEILDSAGEFDKVRLIQAMVVPGIEKVCPFNFGRGEWKDPATEITSTVLIIGMDLDPDFILNEEIRSNLHTLSQTNSVMLDILSHSDFGELSVNREAAVDGLDVTVTSLFRLGMGFYAEGAVIVNNETYYNLTRDNPRLINFGLIKVWPGVDVMAVKRALKETLPSDVIIFDKQELTNHEQDYFISIKPVGIMFQAGVFVAFIVGAVILFQVLSSETSNRLKEFATLKAIGFKANYIYGVGFKQALMFAFMSYLPALLISCVVFRFGRMASKLPMYLTIDLAGFVLLLTFVMCSLSGFLALRKVKRADPADLF